MTMPGDRQIAADAAWAKVLTSSLPPPRWSIRKFRAADAAPGATWVVCDPTGEVRWWDYSWALAWRAVERLVGAEPAGRVTTF